MNVMMSPREAQVMGSQASGGKRSTKVFNDGQWQSMVGERGGSSCAGEEGGPMVQREKGIEVEVLSRVRMAVGA